MRKHQRQEILYIIADFFLLHKQLKMNLETGNMTLAQSLLGTCWEQALMLGNVIKALEGENHNTVKFIEDYCGTLYQQYESLATDYSVHNLNILLQKIENSVKNDIKIRREIVFFPYKASMWDSLESVYWAYKQMDDCDVFCVPIPYFDLKPDRRLGEMRYEGTKFPDNSDVVDWKNYQFEERKPDIVYIHNPYDAWNMVTSVHPRFYSSNLKKYTDQLVYIPYFILDEIPKEDEKKTEQISHFCFLPGIINADRVVVQSENMRQIYIQEYIKEARAQSFPYNKKEIETKILGIGSPKIDKVLNTTLKEISCPLQWIELIEKENGSRKKVILYNTSIEALLQSGDKMLGKIENVLQIFKKYKNEITLLWRPHPLLLSTLCSMRPELADRYKQITEIYSVEKWGIFDDSPDLNRAIVVSDAYYGDKSSVANLFQFTGKLVRFQNACLVEPEYCVQEKCSIWFTDFIIRNGQYYFSAGNLRGIFKANPENGIVTCEKMMSDWEYEYPVRHMSVLLDQENLIMAPYCSTNNGIDIYNLATKELKQISLDRLRGRESHCKFYQMIEWRKKVYLIPGCFPDIVCFDLMTNDIHGISFETSQLRKNERDPLFARSYYIYEDKLYLAAWNNDLLVEINLADETWVCFPLGLNGKPLRTMSGIQERLFLVDLENNISIYHIKERRAELIKYDNQMSGETLFSNNIGMSAIYHKKFVFYDTGKNEIVFLDVNALTYDSLPVETGMNYHNSLWLAGMGNAIGLIKVMEDKLFLFMTPANVLYIINREFDVVDKIHFQADAALLRISPNNVIQEIPGNYVTGLTNYIDYIMNESDEKTVTACNFNYGKVIAEYLV